MNLRTLFFKVKDILKGKSTFYTKREIFKEEDAIKFHQKGISIRKGAKKTY